MQGSGADSRCHCPAHPVGVRGVYEQEFLDAYRRVVNETSPVIEEKNLLSVDQGLAVEVAACQFGKEFRTSFLFDAVAPSLTDEERQFILDSFLQAITEPFLITDAVCNPKFRTFEIAEIGPNRSVDRRRAQQAMSASLSPAPTSSPRPSFTPVPTVSPTQPPILVPTLTSTIIPVYVYVTDVCNGCDDQITFDDETVARRNLQGLDLESTVKMKARTDTYDWVRQLQSDESNSTSNLANLSSVGIPYNISNFREVPVVDCTVTETQFTSQFHYSIALEHNATSTQVQAVGDTYNELIQDFCDPLDHTIDSFELVQFVPTSGEIGQNRWQDYNVTFHLTGRCRGCSGADTLLSSTNTSILSRRSLNQDLFLSPYRFQSFCDDTDGFANTGKHKSTQIFSSSNKPSRRRLQASLGDDCFCDGTIVDTRAPNTDEFNMALVTALSDFQVTSVYGIPNFMPTPQPTSTPSRRPSLSPTEEPTAVPTTEAPTMAPTPSPTDTTTTPAPTAP